MTKYVCMVAGCDFVAEDAAEATAHEGAHPDDPEAAIVEVSYSADAGADCSIFMGGAEEEDEEGEDAEQA